MNEKKFKKELELIGVWYDNDEDGWGGSKIKITETFQIYPPKRIENILKTMGMNDKSRIRIKIKVIRE